MFSSYLWQSIHVQIQFEYVFFNTLHFLSVKMEFTGIFVNLNFYLFFFILILITFLFLVFNKPILPRPVKTVNKM